MTRAKGVVEPGEAVKDGFPEGIESGAVVTRADPAPPPAIEAKPPEWDRHDPNAIHPGETPHWPADYQTFELTASTEIKLNDGTVLKIQGKQFSTANRFLSAQLLALDPNQGVRRAQNPKEKPLCPPQTKS
jgi:hypothetical protein